MNLHAVRQEIDTLRQEARSIAEKADGGDAAAVSRFAAIEARVAELRAQERRAAFLDEADRRAAGTPVGGTGDARLDQLAENVGLLDTIRAQMGATDAGAGRAREVSAEMARRSGRSPEGLLWNMGAAERRTLLTTNAGAIVPSDYRPELFIERLRSATKVRALGATVLSGLSGNVVIPKRATSVAMNWAAEDTPLPVSDPTFASVTLTPKTAGAISEWSRLMVMQSSPDVEALARTDMAAQLSEVLDAAAIAGTGTNAQPTGILNTPGVTIIPAGPGSVNGDTATYDVLADLVGAIDDANADGSTTGFLTNTKVRRSLMKMKDGSGTPLGLATVLQGKNAQFSNIVPSNGTKGTGTNLSTLIYGNWSELLIGLWSELDILVNPYVDPAYSKGNVRIRAAMTCDVAVRHASSFAAITDLKA